MAEDLWDGPLLMTADSVSAQCMLKGELSSNVAVWKSSDILGQLD